MNCYEAIDLMDDALEGRLAPESRPGFEEHMVRCAVCRTYFDQLQVTVRALEQMPRPRMTSRRRSELIAAFQKKMKKSR